MVLQLIGLLFTGSALPVAISYLSGKTPDIGSEQALVTVAASCTAAIVALLAIRKVTSFPGTRHFSYIIPTFSVTFGSAIGVLLVLRVDYASVMLMSAFLFGTLFIFMMMHLGAKAGQSFYVVPFGKALKLVESEDASWILLKDPTLPENDGHTPIVADLRYDFEPEWERMLAAAAISGRAVYHSKQVRESLTGKVEIEHLSENSFGSLVPNSAYRHTKRIVDIVVSLVAIPVLLVPMLLLGVVIRLESPGPILFRQRRMGYRGQDFEVLKFRTMRARAPATCVETAIQDAITQSDDDRITKIGRVLRRSRIDELPQIWNVLMGDMSIIGPRPEAIPLSEWYERELPFYSYRHIVRPGITGWAQVSQGHVADLDSVHTKLYYDFYYIKNFSAWLDLLITIRTVHTILSGFGSK
ncbi:lipopolysaccharide/colanic/teichoic acid biosynthesis glycosyltransferase [Sphingomonas leidyi]|uniref:Lipopolysaccharide/colanic/teichoic acid biosynthesis glycosyltransferase n=1 Tax=Sphingomonas leidyi TaxID=68569 RepID=A0A7X5UXU2_9SPHN|nr:lipopolysaccharide/colanic/teichoic acid biosynthesis glycosyltransferase [Sphingomonas leidyi]